MNKRWTIKISLIVLSLIIVSGGIIAAMIYNTPQRDVQAAETDYSLSSTQIVKEYLNDPSKANDKYLQEEGESKILAVSGKVSSIEKDQNNQVVILLKNEEDKAGVSCTFTTETNLKVSNVKIGDSITIKGVIRSGAGYDSDLDLYEDVIMEKCDVFNKESTK